MLDNTSTGSVPAAIVPTSESVGESLHRTGPWITYARLLAIEESAPCDLKIRGFIELVRSIVVRDFLAEGKGLDAAPKLSAEFLTDYGRFNLSAKEGYLVSLIDGRLTVQRLISVCPFDAFTTIFYLVKLKYQKAITI